MAIDQIPRDLIIVQLSATEKAGVIRELAGAISSSNLGVNHEQVVNVLLAREAFTPTAIGHGVAIPNSRLPNLSNVIMCVGRSQAGIDLGALDGKPTNIFVVVLTPEDSTGAASEALIRIGRIFKETNLARRLMEAPNAHEMYVALVEEDAKY